MTSGEAARAGGLAVRGAQHIRRDQPCQDAVGHRARAFAHGTALALAVADGHGSSPHADVGAQLAVEVATAGLLDFYAALEPAQRARPSTVRELALAPGRRQLVQAWVEAVARHAGAEATPALLRAYGATLLFALAAPDLWLVGQLGDGDVLRVDADGGVRRPLPPEPLAFGDATPSLCQDAAWHRLRLTVTPPPRGECLLLLCTDGYANSYADDATFEQIGPGYLELVREHGLDGVLALLPDFLARVTTEGSGDDVTLGLLHFAAPAPSGATPEATASAGAAEALPTAESWTEAEALSTDPGSDEP